MSQEIQKEFGDYLRRLRKERNLSINELAEKSGISNAQISRLENGERGIPKPETIQKIAEALEVPYEEMMVVAGYISADVYLELLKTNKINIPEELKPIVEERKLIEKKTKEAQEEGVALLDAVVKIRKLSLTRLDELDKLVSSTNDLEQVAKAVHEKKTLQNILRRLDMSYIFSDNFNSNLSEKMVRLPIIGSIRAGEPIERLEYNEGYTLVDPDVLRGREGFALRVKGDSMSGDRIMDGDIVIVVKQPEVQPHEIAVVAVNGEEATLKRVKIQGDMCMLVPSNPEYEPMLYPAKDVHIIGKVVEVKFWPK